ncbi:hypothetical protein BZL29_3909 [Mycobacterium kansasii]|uniref:Thiamine-binding protein domain-containing protein n=1 Tax=Mycobacterium kansasii TaxID=1768 RepID=A0A1V3XE68_MYCKA|nr:hypothetical protein BZL29_3909 [Mycobacterium kansasii]
MGAMLPGRLWPLRCWVGSCHVGARRVFGDPARCGGGGRRDRRRSGSGGAGFGLPNKTDSMFTEIEGDTWDEVMAVVQRAVEAVAARAPRVSTVIKVDWRQGAVDAMTQKVASIERYLSS